MFNPVRRNRNIGKTQGGRVMNGRAIEKLTRRFSRDGWQQLEWNQLFEPGQELRLIRENPSRGFYHPCGMDEYLEVLSRLPDELSEWLKAIVLRRTPRADLRGVQARCKFRCILMNSFPVSRRMEWGPKVPDEHSIKHYAPWCSNWGNEKGQWFLQWTDDEIRRYYLYHLFLHELGHINERDFHALKRREDFAEGFALEWARKLGVIE